MKKIATIILTITIVICFAACNKNNTFNFFGSWVIDGMTMQNENYRTDTGTIKFNDDYTFTIVLGEDSFKGEINPDSLDSSGTKDIYSGTINWNSPAKHLTEEEKQKYKNSYGYYFDVSLLESEAFNKDYDDLKVEIDKTGGYSKLTFNQNEGPLGFLFTIPVDKD